MIWPLLKILDRVVHLGNCINLKKVVYQIKWCCRYIRKLGINDRELRIWSQNIIALPLFSYFSHQIIWAKLSLCYSNENKQDLKRKIKENMGQIDSFKRYQLGIFLLLQLRKWKDHRKVKKIQTKPFNQ